MYKIIVLLIFCSFLQASELTKPQLEKLNSSVVIEHNNTFIIEEYSKILFTKPVLFSQQDVSEVIIRTLATMKKNTIHKEQFIAISSAISNQLIQSVFFTPQYFQSIKGSEQLAVKPLQIPNLQIELLFRNDGIDTKLYSKSNRIERFVSYSEIFKSRMR